MVPFSGGSWHPWLFHVEHGGSLRKGIIGVLTGEHRDPPRDCSSQWSFLTIWLQERPVCEIRAVVYAYTLGETSVVCFKPIRRIRFLVILDDRAKLRNFNLIHKWPSTVLLRCIQALRCWLVTSPLFSKILSRKQLFSLLILALPGCHKMFLLPILLNVWKLLCLK